MWSASLFTQRVHGELKGEGERERQKAYMSHRGHGKLERQARHRVVQLILVVFGEEVLVLLVGRAAVPGYEGIHLVWAFYQNWGGGINGS